MITVVSGLPRSGTSMMMQILQAGGLPLLCDQERPADENNPRGYFEYQKVRRLAADNSWLAEAEGHAIKVVSQLLYHLPRQFEYCIVFMRRDLTEVIRSQEQMLASRQVESGLEQQAMREHFTRHLDALEIWMSKQPNMRVFPCDFSRMIADPARLAPAISAFLGILLDPERMASAIDPTLYRQKAK
ncbi:MAG: Sulfotransferase family protein [Planctomycetaceae bacterium]|nr:Sulfotransferase family protein [Planctomycetaceae bacterium]